MLVDASVRRRRWRRVEASCRSSAQGEGGFGAHVKTLFRLITSRKLLSKIGLMSKLEPCALHWQTGSGHSVA